MAAQIQVQVIVVQLVGFRSEYGGEMRARRVMRKADDAAALLDRPRPRRIDRNRAPVLERGDEAHRRRRGS